MFTGIVQGYFPIKQIERLEKLYRITVQLPPCLLENLQIGASIAINGCCLTVVAFDEDSVSFDAMQETLRVTNLGALTEQSSVNVERAAHFGDEIGGHLLSGHVHDTVTISEIVHEENNVTIYFDFDAKWADYVLPKGYISLNGCSLTIGAEVKDNRFCVHLIPETLRVTCFGGTQVGDVINVEIDSQTQAVVSTVKNYLAHHGV